MGEAKFEGVGVTKDYDVKRNVTTYIVCSDEILSSDIPCPEMAISRIDSSLSSIVRDSKGSPSKIRVNIAGDHAERLRTTVTEQAARSRSQLKKLLPQEAACRLGEEGLGKGREECAATIRSLDINDMPYSTRLKANLVCIPATIAAAGAGWYFTSETATAAAEYMNNISAYLAPITGLVQAGISIGVASVAGSITNLLTSGLATKLAASSFIRASEEQAKEAHGYTQMEALIKSDEQVSSE